VEDRRRAERQAALWMGRCQVEGESSDLWRECAIFDVSSLGLGIDLRHSGAPDLLGRRITVLLELGPSFDLTVAGEVRNTNSGADGILRAGIEFVGLTSAERAIANLLERRAASRSRSLSPH
jgi:hypothetical protein